MGQQPELGRNKISECLHLPLFGFVYGSIVFLCGFCTIIGAGNTTADLCGCNLGVCINQSFQ